MFLAKNSSDAGSFVKGLPLNERLMTDQRPSKQSTPVHAGVAPSNYWAPGGFVIGVGLGLTILFIAYAGLSIFFAYGLGQSKPETPFVENLFLCGILLLTLLVAGVMYPIGWLIYGVYFAVIITITMCCAGYFGSSSQSRNSNDESESSEHYTGVTKAKREASGVATLLTSVIVVSVVGGTWFTLWAVTRDPWWFLNGLDFLR